MQTAYNYQGLFRKTTLIDISFKMEESLLISDHFDLAKFSVEPAMRKRSIFALYAKVFRYLLAKWVSKGDASDTQREKEMEDLILPSNEEWRHKVYYRLVELQRESDAVSANKNMKTERVVTSKESQKWEWSPGRREHPLRARTQQSVESLTWLSATLASDGSMTEACIEPGWRINDILLAANVLRCAKPAPLYADEAETRRVFGLVYDVLRFKGILRQTLEDAGFWYHNGAFRDRERVVWLLLYDMHGRKFARRGEMGAVRAREKAFEAAGLKDIEDALLDSKTRLAASVSRLRIGGSALSLGELLPCHLRAGDVWGDGGAIASGWVNTAVIGEKVELEAEMAKIGMKACRDCEVEELDEDSYAYDPLCPKTLNLHEKARETLAVSDLVRSHRFVFLDRSLCVGAAAIAQAIRSFRLCGPVILTHTIAPRHVGYLTALLADIEDAGRLLAFGAGERKREYEAYLKDLGVTPQQCRIFSEKYVSPAATAELERATIVLATPPCSYTGAKNIVDLAVARGGDTELLETLTNTENEIERTRTLLTEQLATLQYALTRPNVQLLLYEAHTVLPSETTEMVERVVEYANRTAMEKYTRQHTAKKRIVPKEGRGLKTSKSGKQSQSQNHSKTEQTSATEDEIENEDEHASSSREPFKEVPDSDLFVTANMDDIFGPRSGELLDPGCFLAVIKRKEMMQFDSLFMIKMAESKGLFGDPNKQQRPKMETIMPLSRRPSRTIQKTVKIELDRISASTHCSKMRTATRERSPCPRHDRHVAQRRTVLMRRVRDARRRDARRWWTDAIAWSIGSERSTLSKFRVTRTDPITLKRLYPFHVNRIVFTGDREREYVKANLSKRSYV